MATPTINDDSLPGTSGPDSIDGLSGNDIIEGFGGNDTLIGGPGNDAIDGGADNDSLRGDSGADTILGQEGDDSIDGGTESDSLIGGDGNDTVLGGDGNDTIGNFTTADSNGNDSLDGGLGDDRIYDRHGQNTVSGGDGNDRIYASGPSLDGGAGNDTVRLRDNLTGGSSEEPATISMSGGEGDDRLYTSGISNAVLSALTMDGGDGNDRIDGTGRTTGPTETLIGGDGNDSIYANNGDDSVTGDAGNDSLQGGGGADTVDGGAGDDTIRAGGGDDLIDGGSGSETTGDVYQFSGRVRADFALVSDGSGNIITVDRTNTLGRDTVSNIETLDFSDVDLATAGLSLGSEIVGTNPLGELLTGTANDDLITGLEGNDTINGLGGGDIIDGGDGNNTVDGGAGNDGITTGTGSDTIAAAAGDDSVSAGDGDDSVDGGTENDSLLGGGGSDTLVGGDGNDTLGNFTSTDAAGDDSMDGGIGDDRLYDRYGQNTVSGGDGNDTIYAAGPSLDGGIGDDRITLRDNLTGGSAEEPATISVSGGEGNDRLATSGLSNAVLSALTLDGGDGNDRIYGTGRTTGPTETLIGGDGDDTIYANSGDDSVTGDGGNDSLRGQTGNDTVEGGAGDDTINGEAGDDSLLGGTGNDFFTGGTGNDTIDGGDTVGDVVSYAAASTNYVITPGVLGSATVEDTVGSDGTDTISNVSILRFTDMDVVIGPNPGISDTGDADPNTLTGTSGDDTLSGLGGNDSLLGLAGDDSLVGGTENDTLLGDLGSDTLEGGDGNDSLIGGGQDDTLDGGEGNDRLGSFNANDAAGDDSLIGGLGDDSIYDRYGQNTVSGGDGNDRIYVSGPLLDGGIGNDSIRLRDNLTGGSSEEPATISMLGGEGDDRLYTSGVSNSVLSALTMDGGDGNDRIYGTGRTVGPTETLIGGDGDDRIYASSGDDSVTGDAGNDTIRDDAGNDTVEAGAGDDSITASAGDDLIDGGSGGETAGDVYRFNGRNRADFALIDGGAGAIISVDRNSTLGRDTLTNIETLDFLDVDLATAGLGLGIEVTGTNPAGESLTGTANDDLITGLEGNDTISGLEGGDIIDGGDGDNTIDSGAGNDGVTSGTGNDTVTAGAGADRVDTGDGDDSIEGGTENDTLIGGAGNDTVIGGDGNDRVGEFGLANAAGDDSLVGGLGDDSIYDRYGQNTVSGGDGNDRIYASGPSLDGGVGNDTVRLRDNLTGGNAEEPATVSMSGGEGDDRLYTSGISNSVLSALTMDGGDGNDRIYGTGRTVGPTETLIGGDGDDTISANSGDDSVTGDGGNDFIRGQNGNDTIEGGAGDDLLEGEGGNDTIDGGVEATEDGDVAVFNGARGNYSIIGDALGLTVVDNVGSDGTDVILNVERLRFTDGDVIVASGLVGASIVGTEFDDNGLPGNPGALVGTILNDTIVGLAGDDRIEGLAGFDDIDAGDGDDTARGGEGDDTLDMGDGRDVVQFAGNIADYNIVGDQFGATVTDLDPNDAGDDGTDQIVGARVLSFADGDVFFNAAPTPDAESFTTDEDTQIVIPIADLLDGDTDSDGDPLSIVRVENASNGTAFISGSNVVFNPAADFNGTASFEYVVSDTFVEVNQAVTITVNPVNDRPDAVNDTATTSEDTAVTIDVLDNDSDPEGDALTVTSLSAGANINGTSVINPDNTITFTPDPDFNGLVSFNYTVDDGNGGTDIANVALTVTAVNDAPVGVDDSFSTAFETTLNIPAAGVLANDTDVDNVPGDLNAVLDTNVSNGSLTLNADGSFDYTPDAGFTGTDTFTYFANDGTDDSAATTVTITVQAQSNVPPVGVADGYAVDEDNTLTVDAAAGVLANDTDGNGDALTANPVLVTDASNGSVTLNTDGSFEYTPNENFNGVDSFEYEVSDGNGGTDTAIATITVNPINDDPVANDDTVVLNEDEGSVTLDTILDNDTDVDGDTLEVVGVGDASNGEVSFESDGTVNYTPDPDFFGSDSFTYDISDGQGGTSTATINITVNPVNDAPVGVDDSFSTPFETTLNIPAAGVLANDTDVDNVPGDLSAVLDTNVSNGSLTLNADGSFDYTPDAGFTGTDTFTYFANDGTDDSAATTVTITVQAQSNVPPVGVADGYAVDEDNTLTVDAAAGVLANDTDGNGDALTANPVLVTDASNGSVTLNTDGSFEYTPNENFNGVDSFEYEVSDGNGGTDTAIATITVNPINDDPVANDDTVVLNEDEGSVTLDTILDNDTDVDGDTLEVVGVGDASNGEVSFESDGTVNYTPDPDFFGSDSFTYDISDGQGGTDTATVNITVNPVNDAPVGVDDSFSTPFETTLNIPAAGVLANDTDVDNVPADLSAVLDTNVSNGSLTLNADGSFDYTPNGGFTGTDTFTYFANDGTDDSAATTVTITVQAQSNVPPVGVADGYAVDEDNTLTVDAAAGVLANDTDGNGDALTANPVLVTDASNGSVTLNTDGSFEYTPNENFNGVDSFEYEVSDGNGGTDTAIATITVNPVNDAPVGVDDSYSTAFETTLNIPAAGVLGNDTDVDNVPGDLSAVLDTNVSNGSLTLNADGSFDYTPNAGFTGTDTFTYFANDGTDDSAATTVTITVEEGVNEPPVAVDNNTSTEQATPRTLDPTANDTDPNGDDLDAVIESQPTNGIALLTDGGVTYLPDSGFVGGDTFDYRVFDGNGGEDVGTINIDVVEPDSEINGNAARNFLRGTNANDVIFGEGEADRIFGNGGNDVLLGGEGSDQINGGAGNDVLLSGPGRGTLLGGPGSDLFVITEDSDFQFLRDFELGSDSVLLAVESLLTEDGSLDSQKVRLVDTSGNDALLQVDFGGGFETLANLNDAAGSSLDDVLFNQLDDDLLS